MRWQAVAAALALMVLAGCQTSSQRAELLPLEQLLPGYYTARYDGEVIYHKIVVIRAPTLGKRVLYHQISREGFDGAAAQQKIYVLKPSGDGMRALVVSQDSEKYRNLETKPQLAADLREEAFLQFPSECDFVWTKETDGYLGRVEPTQCQYDSPAFGGAINPSMTYRLTARELAITETLLRANGEPVFPTSHMVGVRTGRK